ncbi:FHA domain-containing protein [Streptomyces sp. CA-249302]|uniref:FHA domain-containing protein n=1 Tax=Streptomyces sp. CA-249302 TaxID=3240058 RepID=UPI003D8E7A41
MDRLTCDRCDTEVGSDEVVCPECRAVLTTDGAVRVVRAEDRPAPPPAPATVTSPVTGGTCPHCRASVDPADLVCMRCLRELPSDDGAAPPGGDALRTTLERPVTSLRLSFDTGTLEVRPGQEVVLGRRPEYTESAPLLAAYDNVSRMHATVGLDSDGSAWLRDERSANGTWADEIPVPQGQARPLQDGSVIRLASNVSARVRLRNERPRD